MRKLIFILIFLLLAIPAIADSSELEIDGVEITSDGKTLLSTSSSGKIRVDPGAELSINVRLENLFDDDSDMRIEDIRVTAMIEDIDDGSDISDESDKIYVREESKRTVKLKLKIPKDASSYQDYDLEIEARGYDEDGVLHEDDVVIDVEVEREEHELVFEKLWINDVYCDRQAAVRIELQNIGEEFEEDIELTILSNELGTLFMDRFDLPSIDDEEANTYTKTKQIDVEELEPGLHAITVKVEYDEEKGLIEKTIEFTVESCSSAEQAAITEEERVDRTTERYSNPKRDLSFLYSDEEQVVLQMPPAAAWTPKVPQPAPEDNTFSTLVLMLANIALIAFIILLLMSLYED